MNLEEEIFYADNTLSATELECNIVLEKGELIPEFCTVEVAITIPDAHNADGLNIPGPRIIAADHANDVALSFADAAHGENFQFFVNKSIPLFNLSNVLVTLDNEILLNTNDIRPLEQQAYSNKYKQMELFIENLQTFEGEVVKESMADMCDVIELTKINRVLHYSFRLTDFLPLIFEDRILNIEQQMTIELNFKNVEKMFWISNTGGETAIIDDEFVGFYNYETGSTNYVPSVTFVDQLSPTFDIKLNCLYNKVPVDEMSVITQTAAFSETKTKIEHNVKLSDTMMSQFEVLSLFKENANPFDCNIINEEAIKSDSSAIEMYRNNQMIYNPQESIAYNEVDNTNMFVQYLKKMLSIEEPNNNLLTKCVGQLSLENYVNKLVEYRLIFTGTATDTKTSIYVNYINENIANVSA